MLCDRVRATLVVGALGIVTCLEIDPDWQDDAATADDGTGEIGDGDGDGDGETGDDDEDDDDAAGCWSHSLGTVGTDYAYAIASDGAGDLVIVGGTDGALSGAPAVGVFDSYLAGYDVDGNQRWLSQRAEPGLDLMTDIAVHAEYGLFTTGYVTPPDQAGSPHRELAVARHALDGTVVWREQPSGPERDVAWSIAVDAAGNVYVSGTSDGPLLGTSPLGGDDGFVLSYDPSGAFRWIERVGTDEDDDAFGVAVGPTGQVVIVGKTVGELDGHVALGDDDVIVASFDGNGVEQWARQLGTADSDAAFVVAVTDDGAIYLAGETRGDWGDVGTGDADTFVVRLDADGELVWVSQWGSIGHDHADGIVVEPAGGVVVVGMQGATASDSDDGDVMAARLEASSGQLTTVRQIASDGHEEAHGIVVAGERLFVTGVADRAFEGSPHLGELDAFVFELCW